MNISVTNNIEKVLQTTGDLRANSPFAIKEAINDSLFSLRSKLPGVIEHTFDKPTGFSTNTNAWSVSKANKTMPIGVIELRPAQREYLQWQVFGGTELPKKNNIPIPTNDGGVKAGHGGLTRGWKKVFSNNSKYFDGIPKMPKSGGAIKPLPGIYQRVGKSKRIKGKSGEWKYGKLKIVLLWEKSTHYNIRWNFDETCRTIVSQEFEQNFRKRLQESSDFIAARH